MSAAEKLKVLQDLLGRQLGAVVFVQDYLQLQFDGSTLTITTWPVIHREGEVMYGEPRYRDALCECITRVVEVADVVEHDRLRIVFGDRTQLIVSLKDADRADAEAVRLNQEDGQWWVW